jgi:site-specific DNA recombinase
MRVVIYARLSQRSATNELNIVDQLKRCREYANARSWAIVAELADFHSAYDNDRADDRPGFGTVLELVHDKAVDVVLSWRPDRLWRDPIEAAVFMRSCVKGGVTSIATVTEGERDPANPGDEMVTTIVAAVGRYESAAKSARLKAKARQLAELGVVGGGGTRPFGYNDDRMTVRGVEADALRQAARVVLATGSLRAGCRHLETIVPTVNGGPWQTQVLRHALVSPRNAGLREHHGKIIGPAVWPAILDTETHAALCALLLDPARRLTGNPTRYLLTGGMARCGLCGAALVARPRTDGARCYVCATGIGFKGCGKIRRLAEPVDTEVIARLRATIDQTPPEQEETRPAAVIAELNAADAALTDLARDHYVLKLIGRTEYFAAREPLAARVADLRAATVGGGRPLPPPVLDNWDAMSWGAARAALLHYIDKVTIHPARRGLNRFDPTRIVVTWR